MSDHSLTDYSMASCSEKDKSVDPWNTTTKWNGLALDISNMCTTLQLPYRNCTLNGSSLSSHTKPGSRLDGRLSKRELQELDLKIHGIWNSGRSITFLGTFMLRISTQNHFWSEQEISISLENMILCSRVLQFPNGLNHRREKGMRLTGMQERYGTQQSTRQDLSRLLCQQNKKDLVLTLFGGWSMIISTEVTAQDFSTMKFQNQLTSDTKVDSRKSTKKDSIHSKTPIKTLIQDESLVLIPTRLRVRRRSKVSLICGRRLCLGFIMMSSSIIQLVLVTEEFLRSRIIKEFGDTTGVTTSKQFLTNWLLKEKSPAMMLTEQGNSLIMMDFLQLLFSILPRRILTLSEMIQLSMLLKRFQRLLSLTKFISEQILLDQQLSNSGNNLIKSLILKNLKCMNLFTYSPQQNYLTARATNST